MEGEGILKCKEFKYSGQLKNSVPHGVGSMDWITGDSYSGEFCEGNMHGKGHLKQSTGESYIGDFNMNQRTGNAKIIYIDNTSYEGDVKEGKPDGFGTLIFPQNHIYLKYSGHFKDGKFHSEGQLDYQNGNSYKGEWDLGIKSGRGVQKTTEYVYEGGFYNDKYHGFGEFKHGKAFCVGT